MYNKRKYDLRTTSATPKTSVLIPAAATPIVFFSDLAWSKLWHIVNLAEKEIGWYGMVDEYENGDFLITDLYIPEQEVSGTTTDIEPEALGKLAHQLEAQGLDSSKLRYWGHSHVNMPVSPSKTDEDQIEEYLDDCDWFIRGIHNKQQQSKIDVYDTRANLVHECVRGMVAWDELTQEQYDALRAEMKANVKAKVYANTRHYGNNQKYWDNNRGKNGNTVQSLPVPANSGAGGYASKNADGGVYAYGMYFDNEAELQELYNDPFAVGGNS